MSTRFLLPAVTAAVLATSVAPAQAASGASLAKSVKASIAAATKVDVTKMTCPSKVAPAKGKTYTCNATFATGDKSPVKVRFSSATRYKATVVNFLTRQLEGQLKESFGAASATCPKTVKIKKGDTFTCTVTDDQGNDGIVDITQTGKGRADAKLRQ